MEITILAVGKIKDAAWLEKVEDYSARVKHDCRLEFAEIKDSDPKSEGEKLLKHSDRCRGYIIALDERGTLCTSAEFARKIRGISGRIVFIIGGPSGLDEAVKNAAHERLALSPMTFTHEMARVLLLEQIYRALAIIKNHPYHRA